MNSYWLCNPTLSKRAFSPNLSLKHYHPQLTCVVTDNTVCFQRLMRHDAAAVLQRLFRQVRTRRDAAKNRSMVYLNRVIYRKTMLWRTLAKKGRAVALLGKFLQDHQRQVSGVKRYVQYCYLTSFAEIKQTQLANITITITITCSRLTPPHRPDPTHTNPPTQVMIRVVSTFMISVRAIQTWWRSFMAVTTARCRLLHFIWDRVETGLIVERRKALKSQTSQLYEDVGEAGIEALRESLPKSPVAKRPRPAVVSPRSKASKFKAPSANRFVKGGGFGSGVPHNKLGATTAEGRRLNRREAMEVRLHSSVLDFASQPVSAKVKTEFIRRGLGQIRQRYKKEMSESEANSSSLHQALVVVEKAEGITAHDCRMLLDGRTLYMTSKILRHVHSHRPGQARKQRYKLRPWPERMHLLALTSRKAVEGWIREAEKEEQRQRRVKRVRKGAFAIGKRAVVAKRAEAMDMPEVVEMKMDVMGISQMVDELELERQVAEAESESWQRDRRRRGQRRGKASSGTGATGARRQRRGRGRPQPERARARAWPALRRASSEARLTQMPTIPPARWTATATSTRRVVGTRLGTRTRRRTP